VKFIPAAVLAVTLVSSPALAATTFAQFEELDGSAQTIEYDGLTLADADGALGSIVLFNFLDFMPVDVNGQVEAYMNVESSGSPWDGTISFTRVTDGANLLTLAFTGATLAGSGGAGALFGSQPSGTVTYSSDFVDFTGQTAGDFSLGFSGITPGFSTTVAWSADAVGTFASDSANIPGGGGVPEPATWAMMIVGFGGVGALLRRRRTLAFA
jgi:hypothetical protein